MTDPRFDPRFQRGYDGQQPIPSDPAPSVPARGIAPEPPADDSWNVTREPESPVQLAPVRDSAAVDGVEPWAPRRRNPYAIALLLVGLAMILLGGWLTRVYATTALNGYTSDQQTNAILQQQLAPALLVGGFAAVIAWLVLGAFGALARGARA